MEPQKLSKLTTQKVTPEAHATPAAPKQDSVTAPARVSVAVPVPPPAAVAAAPEVRPVPAPALAPPPKPSRPKDLQSIRSLYIEKMEEQFDENIKDEIRKQLPALHLAAGRADADAVMKGTVEKRDNTGSKVTRGYLGMKSEYSATVTITDIGGIGVLWSGDAGDARALVGAIKRGGLKRVAERIVGELRKAMAK
jgi:hypothetical protein